MPSCSMADQLRKGEPNGKSPVLGNATVAGDRALVGGRFGSSSEAWAQAVMDEARQAGRSAQSFPAADEDYFRGMDGGIALTPDEVKGRNMWIVWTGGDDRLWDDLTNITFGNFDLLKILSSYPGLKYSRDNRWNYFGLVNEPCFTKATGPNPQRYGLWLDVRDPNCPPTLSRMRKNIPASRSARAARTSRPDPITDTRPGSSDCGSSPTPISTRPRQKNGMPSAFTTTRAIIYRRSWSPLPRRNVLRLLSCRSEPRKAAGEPRGAAMGEFELDRRRAIFLGRSHLRLESRIRRPSSSSSCTRRGPARWIRRWYRATTSTIRAR